MKILASEAASEAQPDLERLFRQYHRRVYDIAWQFTGSRADAADVVQEVFLKVHRNLAGFRNDSAVETWLYRLTVNCCIDQKRFWKRFRNMFPISIVDSSPQGNLRDDHADRQELVDAVRRAVASLPPRFRMVVILRDFEAFTYEHIAEILEISPGTVASRLSRAYGKLAELLKQQGLDRDFQEL